MNATILSIFAKSDRWVSVPRNWTTQEVAELYRVCEHLGQAGIRVIIDTGLSDEGEPWAVFEQCETGDVVVHIARIDGELIVSNGVSGEIYRGANFRALTSQMLEGAPLALPRFGAGSNVVMHPRVVLTAFVAATVVLAELARSTGAAEAREAQAKAAEVAPDGSAVDILSRLMSRDQAQLLASAQSSSTAVSIGLAAAAAYAAQLAAEEVRASSESDGDTGGWLNFLLADSRMGDTSPVERVDDDGAALALTAQVSGDHAPDGQDAPEIVQISMPRVSFEDDGAARPIVTELQVAAHTATNIKPPLTLIDTEETTVSLTSKVTVAETDGKTAGKAKSGFETQSTEYLAKVMLKVEAALLTLDVQALDINAARASAAGAGAIVVKKSDKAPGQSDADVVALAEPTAAKFMAPPPAATYKLASTAAPALHLGAGEDVVVYMGGKIEVFGFVFGEDRIAFIDSARDTNWLSSVKIIGTDVILSGNDGGSITLRDAISNVA